MKHMYPKINFVFIKLKHNTRGATETLHIAVTHLKSIVSVDTPVLCLDGDNFYTTNVISLWNKSNVVITFNDTQSNPIYSYVTVDDTNNITHIIEKKKISNTACTGAYGFASLSLLEKYTKTVITNEIYVRW